MYQFYRDFVVFAQFGGPTAQIESLGSYYPTMALKRFPKVKLCIIDYN